MKTMRKIIIVVLIWTLALSSFSFAVEPQGVSRVNFVKEILKVMDAEIDKDISSPFNDILNNEDIPYLATAFNKKIVTGNGGTFSPKEPITNEQAVIMLVRALGVINISQDEASKTKINFSDADQISDWAKPYVSYAIKHGLIEDSQNKFNPQLSVTNLQSQEMLNRFKEAFIKEDLTAAQVLILADNKLSEHNTYKLTGTMNISTNIKQPNGQQETAIIEVHQAGTFKAPDTVYTISKSISSLEGQPLEEIFEMYMKDNSIYIRSGQNKEWIQMDANLIMMQIEPLMGNIEQGSPQLSSQQLEIVGMYARYGEDVNINGQEYYVIKVDLDPEAFMEMYNEVIEKTFGTMVEGEAWEEIKKENGVPEVMDEETFKSILKAAAEQTLKNTEIQMMQEYYIHKESKSLDKLLLKQVADMELMGVETKVEMEGQYEYYGFGENVVFPEVY